jgi:DNA-binding transcriptional MerR regulator
VSEFPIRVLSELTEVPATTLRAWERRYGLLKPKRTPKGHRLYDGADLETVRQVVQLLEADHPISRAAKILRDGAPNATAPADAGSSLLPGLRTGKQVAQTGVVLGGPLQKVQQGLRLVAGDDEQPLVDQCSLCRLAGALQDEVGQGFVGGVCGAAQHALLLRRSP